MGKKSSAKIYDEILRLLKQSALSINLKNYKQKKRHVRVRHYLCNNTQILTFAKTKKAHLFPNIVYDRMLYGKRKKIVSKIYARVRINTH